MHRVSVGVLACLAGALGLSPLGATVASAAGDRAPAPTPEEALQAEFEAAGLAMREELAHQAEGDALGAAVAEKAMQAHRARYLDLKRDIERRLRVVPSMELEARIRSPFAPDPAWFAAPSLTPPPEAHAMSERRPVKAQSAPWDMYRVRARAEEAREASTPVRAWGMYGGAPAETPKPKGQSQPVVERASDAGAQEPLDAEPPTKPFLVYRNPRGSDEAREVARDP